MLTRTPVVAMQCSHCSDRRSSPSQAIVFAAAERTSEAHAHYINFTLDLKNKYCKQILFKSCICDNVLVFVQCYPCIMKSMLVQHHFIKAILTLNNLTRCPKICNGAKLTLTYCFDNEQLLLGYLHCGSLQLHQSFQSQRLIHTPVCEFWSVIFLSKVCSAIFFPFCYKF